jgi:hypothetical protein
MVRMFPAIQQNHRNSILFHETIPLNFKKLNYRFLLSYMINNYTGLANR